MSFDVRKMRSALGRGAAGAAVALVLLGPARAAGAVTSLKQVQVSNGSQIDLLFDGKVQKSQIRTEFFNDVIQLSLSDVSVYPAKISSVNGGSLVKIFAYQYAPKLVRCRFTVKGKADSYRDKLDVRASGRILTIRLDDGSARGAEAAAAERVAPGSAGDLSPAAQGQAIQDPEEKALLERVLAGTPGAPEAAAPAAPRAADPAKAPKDASGDSITVSASAAQSAGEAKGGEVRINSTAEQPVRAPSPSIAGGKALPSPLKAFGKMALVLGLFGLVALVLKKVAQGRASARLGAATAGEGEGAGGGGGMLGAIGRFARKGLARNGKMIEVLSTHYLGPKKSIAVVRVAGRMLVLGVSNDAINLITQLSGDESDPLGEVGKLDLSGLGIEPRAADPAFSDLLAAERGKPSLRTGAGPYGATAAGKPAYSQAPAPAAQGDNLSGVRAQIRSRLEGLKPL